MLRFLNNLHQLPNSRNRSKSMPQAKRRKTVSPTVAASVCLLVNVTMSWFSARVT